MQKVLNLGFKIIKSYEAKRIKKNLIRALKSYLKGQFEKSMTLLSELDNGQLDKEAQFRLRRVLDLLLVGEFYGLHTLRSILDSLDITSNNLYKIWQKFTAHQIRRLVQDWGVYFFKAEMRSLLSKSAATWSRKAVTIVIDDSIFKQWLSTMPRGKTYSKFFSGQTHSSVYGFKVQLTGVAIGEEFYPIYFRILSRSSSSKQVALSLTRKVKQLFTDLTNELSVTYPNLYLSVDSGFTCPELITYCQDNQIGFIGVPKKTNVFIWKGGNCLKIKDFIDQHYLTQKKEHDRKYHQKGEQPPAFLLRIKVYLQAIGRPVTLLFFQLKGSKKVTAIFCSQLSIKAKTLRRRFFQRTQIEQLFRFIKDTLKIQKNKSKNCTSFVKKLSVGILKVMICYQFKRFCNKRIKCLKGWAFTKIRHHIIYQQVDMCFLKQLVD